MKTSLQWVVTLSLSVASFAASAQSTYDMGKTLYQDNCAGCHGATGKGDGPLKAYLIKAPSDLTTITQRHQGTFPQQRLWETIDGRGSTEPGPHGSREMPIWGNEFKAQTERGPWWGMPYGGMHRGGPEWQVHQKISALIDYLARIQVK
jgi:mono/diheme cytochrome c family protein